MHGLCPSIGVLFEGAHTRAHTQGVGGEIIPSLPRAGADAIVEPDRLAAGPRRRNLFAPDPMLVGGKPARRWRQWHAGSARRATSPHWRSANSIRPWIDAAGGLAAIASSPRPWLSARAARPRTTVAQSFCGNVLARITRHRHGSPDHHRQPPDLRLRLHVPNWVAPVLRTCAPSCCCRGPDAAPRASGAGLASRGAAPGRRPIPAVSPRRAAAPWRPQDGSFDKPAHFALFLKAENHEVHRCSRSWEYRKCHCRHARRIR